MTHSAFLRLLLTLLLFGCTSLPAPPVVTSTATPAPTPSPQSFTGRVIDMEGNPLSKAEVRSSRDTTTSDEDGWFELPSDGSPQWITASREGFISRTRAGAPGAPTLFRLSPDDGQTIVIQFGGDTMFGRRFFDPNEDGDTSDSLLPVDPDVEDHLKLLEPIRPLLGQADLTVVNLESPLTDKPYYSARDPRPTVYHTTKDYVFSSDTAAIQALKEIGVDVVDIGNNHLYDLLESGLQSTLTALDTEDMKHFGGGTDEASAWAPLIMTVNGQKVAFIGCTTIKQPIPPATTNDVTYVASDILKKGGAALCDELRLQASIIQAKQEADVVIAMIHGGYEYSRLPSNQVARLAATARNAGATLVVNHHSHMVGGLSWDGKSLAAWSLGNFIFDQDVWSTFESYLLTVYLTNGKVSRAFVDPLMLEEYVPRGLTGQQADHVSRIAGSVEGPFVLEDGVVEVDVDQRALQMEYVKSMDGGPEPGQIVALPQSQWISAFQGAGTLHLGRDLLWVGSFEDKAVDGAPGQAPLWDTTKESIQVGQAYAYEGRSGIRLTRSARNFEDAVTSHLHRVLVEPRSNLSITGSVRASPNADILVQLSWYTDYKGSPFLRTTEPIAVSVDDQWQSFRVDTQAPPEAVALGVFLRLVPPNQGVATADFDQIRIIEWAPANTKYNPFYNYALLTGTGELTFIQRILPGAEQWLTDPAADQIR